MKSPSIARIHADFVNLKDQQLGSIIGVVCVSPCGSTGVIGFVHVGDLCCNRCFEKEKKGYQIFFTGNGYHSGGTKLVKAALNCVWYPFQDSGPVQTRANKTGHRGNTA